MDIGDWLARGAVVERARACDKRQALAVVADTAARSFDLKAPGVLTALLQREQEGSTGVGRGVAVPHAKLAGLTRMRAVFVRLEAPVAFDAVDDLPVDLLFALFAPLGAETEHLRALARASRLLRSSELREQLRQARSADALHAILAREEQATAA